MGKNQKIIFILILSLVLRLVRLNQSFWLDEGAQVLMSSKSLAFQWFGRINDFQPPLFYLLTHFWLKIGHSEVFLRILPVLFGILTIYFTFLIGKRLKDERLGLFTALILSTSAYHVYYSQEMRMYSLFGLLITASFYSLITRKWLFYTLVTAASLYTHYFSFFFIFAQLIWVFVFKRKMLRVFLGNLMFSFLLFIPWFPMFFAQIKSGNNLIRLLPAWKNVASLSLLKALPLLFFKFSIGRITFDNKSLYVLVAFLTMLFFGFLLYRALRSLEKEKIFLLSWLAAPLLMALIFSIFAPSFQPFRLLPAIVPLFLLFGWGILDLEKKYQKLVIFLILLINFSGLFFYFQEPQFQREDWRSATAFVQSEAPEGSVIIFKFSDAFAPYLWYSKKEVEVASVVPLGATHQLIEDRTVGVINGKKNLFLFEYLGGLTDPVRQVEKVLEREGYQKIETKDFSGVGFVYNYRKEVF